MNTGQELTARSSYELLRELILERDHPCLMARAVFKSGNVIVKAYGELGSYDNAPVMLGDLQRFVSSFDFEGEEFYSFIAVFRAEKVFSEREFESRLWRQLQSVSDRDVAPWDPQVSSEPESPRFSMSIAGHAFYVVGMHQGSSRISRRSPFPVLVFNLHQQFQKLRERGLYTAVRNKIRELDFQLQGSVNPVLEDFGERSEARQYSGREVETDWKCPFQRKK